MAILLFNLRYVPDDEAQEIRDLLNGNDIDFYETSAGILGFSMAGIWLKNEEQVVKARQLIDEYQQLRQSKAREEYRLRQKQGTTRTVTSMFKEDPLRYSGYILAIILICYFMILLFFKLRN